MTLIVRLISKYALWIYVLCAVGMLFYLRAALAARNEGAQAIFSLERESAAKRVYSSSGMILVLLLIVVGVYGLSHYVDWAPTNTGAGEPRNPAPGAAETQAATAAEATKQRVTDVATGTPITPDATMEATPTRRPRVTVVAPPAIVQDTPTPLVVPASCQQSSVQILQPGQNQVIDVGIEVRGTATRENFDRYEFKFQSRDIPGDEWHWVETFNIPVQTAALGYWSTAHLPSGRYRFMLIAIDKSGNSRECIVSVVVQH